VADADDGDADVDEDVAVVDGGCDARAIG